MSPITSQEVLDTANTLNTAVYGKLSESLGSATDKIDSLINTDQISDLLKSEFETIKDNISGAVTDIGTVQSTNLDFLNYFKDFATQNLVNQKITNLYSDNQNKNLNTISEAIEQDNINKMRMTEINRYYTLKTDVINAILKDVLIGIALLLLIVVLAKKEIIPPNISYTLAGIISGYVIILVIYNIYDISRRDDLNFDEYTVPFDLNARIKEKDGNLIDITKELKTELQDSITGSKGLENVLGCIGESCCAPGTIYDIKMGQCIDDCPTDCSYVNNLDNPGCYLMFGGQPSTTKCTR